MSDQTSHDLIVIGAGVAGLAAARQALQLGLATALLESQMFGGLVLNVNDLDGDIAGSGADLASTMMGEAADLGVEYLNAIATGVAAGEDGLAVTSDAGGHRARVVILASGAALKKLGVPGEAELGYKGVSHCADCDGPMFQGQDVLVAGGGDSALQSALVLSKFCGRVHLVHRGDSFRAKPHFAQAVAAAPNIEVHWHTVVEAVRGSEAVEGAQVRNFQTQQTRELACSGFFAFVGLQPASEPLPAAVRRDERGAVVTGADLQTAVPGLYAAGAVRSGCGGMIGDAIADGEAAARAAASFLASVSST